ncbi:MAG: prepilin-type cleavage/methylation domain-containing protein [Alicyclobacillus sp.]|nr:prepilin-type cleavage/methylation domain-containing protein [Alicyclobacillus sp.]
MIREPARTGARLPAPWPGKVGDEAFTLLETAAAVFLTGVLFLCALPAWGRAIAHLELADTSLVLLSHLRYAQAAAEANDTYAYVRFAMYSPFYQTYVGTRQVDAVSFAPGVQYKDGYLQLSTGTVLYDALGNAQVGGVVRLVSGQEEMDVRLFLGSGLQSMGGDTP